MEIRRAGGAMGRRVATAAAFLLLAGAVIAVAAGGGGGGVGRPCFDACFDQCVPRDEFWFCQFSCYHRCSGGGRAAAARGGEGDCEQACVLSMCGQIDPESKMMAVCRDTCRKSYATEGCRRPSSSTSSAM